MKHIPVLILEKGMKWGKGVVHDWLWILRPLVSWIYIDYIGNMIRQDRLCSVGQFMALDDIICIV